MNKRTIVTALLLAVFALVLVDNASALTKKQKEAIQKEAQATEQAGDNAIRAEKFSEAVTHYQKAVELYESIGTKPNEVKSAQGSLADRLRTAQQGLQKQEAANRRITEPLTEADFEYTQNRQGKITITKYKGGQGSGIRDLIIPAQIQGVDVTEIAGNAFARSFYDINNRWRLDKRRGEVFESVTIPSTVTSIGGFAFVDRGIKTLNLPEGIVYIGRGAFAENQITAVTLPQGIREITAIAFAKNQIASITIPSGVTEIGSGAFGGNKLTEIVIPENVTRINACAFAGNMISKVTFSNSGKLETIEGAAFSENRLRSVILPEGLTGIVEGGTEIDRSYGLSYLGSILDVGSRSEVFFKNPLGYIKIPSTLKGLPGTAPIVDSVSGIGINSDTVAIKIGANVSLRSPENFANFYESQGKKAGIYIRKGQIWTTGTQDEFDALIAEHTK